MTMLLAEGFEGYDVSGDRTALDKNFNYQDTIGTSEAGLTTGRNSVGIAAFYDDGILTNSGYHGHIIPCAGLSSEDTWIVGFAFYTNHNWFEVSATSRSPLLQFVDSDGEVMVSIYPAAGTLNVRSGDIGDGAKLGFADALIATKVWHYLECKVNFHASTGTLALRVNEEEVLTLTGLNTATTTSGDLRPSAIVIGGGTIGQRVEVDDICIMDDAGSVNNDFIGDVRIERLNPSGNGNSSQFVGSDADSTDNYLLVDETVVDDDTTYVESSTAAEKDTYAFGNSSESPASIAAVSVKSWARKTDAGSRNFVHTARSSTTEGDSAVLYPSVDYRFMESIFETDPNTAAAWAMAAVNAGEFGFKVNA